MLTRCEQEIYCDGALLQCEMQHNNWSHGIVKHKTSINASLPNDDTKKLIDVKLEWTTSC